MFVTLPAAARKAPNISALFPLLPDKDVEIVGAELGYRRPFKHKPASLCLPCVARRGKYKCILARHVSNVAHYLEKVPISTFMV